MNNLNIKVGFSTKLKLQFEFKENGVKWYSLKEPLIYKDGKTLVSVPKDSFLSDIASIPPMLHWLYPPLGKYSRASVLHDWNYSDRALSRLRADNIYLRSMKADKVPFVNRWAFYLAVRLFGRSHKV